jgi:hypothetical protein
MRLVDVDVVGLEPAQGSIDRFMNVFAGKARIVRACPCWKVDLGKDLQSIAAFPSKSIPEDALRSAVGVHVGGVEGRDTDVERGADARSRLLCFKLRTVRDPVAVADGGYLKAAVPQMPELHGHFPPESAQGFVCLSIGFSALDSGSR